MSNFDAIKAIHGEDLRESQQPARMPRQRSANMLEKVDMKLLALYVVGFLVCLFLYKSPFQAILRLAGLTLLWRFPIAGFVLGGVIIGKGVDLSSQVLGIGLMLYSAVRLSQKSPLKPWSSSGL